MRTEWTRCSCGHIAQDHNTGDPTNGYACDHTGCPCTHYDGHQITEKKTAIYNPHRRESRIVTQAMAIVVEGERFEFTRDGCLYHRNIETNVTTRVNEKNPIHMFCYWIVMDAIRQKMENEAAKAAEENIDKEEDSQRGVQVAERSLNAMTALEDHMADQELAAALAQDEENDESLIESLPVKPEEPSSQSQS